MTLEQLEFPILLTATTQEEIGKAGDHYQLTSDEVTQAALAALSILIPAWRSRNANISEEVAARVLLTVNEGFRTGGVHEKAAWAWCRKIWGHLGSVDAAG